MKEKRKIAKSTEEFERRFDNAEDLVKDIDRVRERIGVDRGALIKVWLHEKVQEEKATQRK